MNASASPEKRKVIFIADIGTTTIKASLCAQSGSVGKQVQQLAALSEKNAQSVFGIDVISRVLYAHHNGVEPLQKKVLSQLLAILGKLYETADIKPEMLSLIILTGNTVMLHLARGLSVQGFEMAPFTPVTVEPAEIPFSELFAKAACVAEEEPGHAMPAAETPVLFPPCIDAFLGADAVCAALYSWKQFCPESECGYGTEKPILIADVGTNTEIMMLTYVEGKDGNDLKLSCCSTAAGPAFEGGVCGGRYTGSELVHMLSELLETGGMDETGLLLEADGSLGVQASVHTKLTQDAVRQLQLAKGAVCAAIETLLKEEGLAVSDVGMFVLCGNFGSALNVEEAERIGLFPVGLAPVTKYAGNAAELGAQLLVCDEMREKAKKIAASGKLVQLAGSSYFARRYIERMNFAD